MRKLIVVVCLICTALLVFEAWAQSSGGDFEINRVSLANGGGRSAGGEFSATATIGQHNAGLPASGGMFALQGGFWAAGSGDFIFSGTFELMET